MYIFKHLDRHTASSYLFNVKKKQVIKQTIENRAHNTAILFRYIIYNYYFSFHCFRNKARCFKKEKKIA